MSKTLDSTSLSQEQQLALLQRELRLCRKELSESKAKALLYAQKAKQLCRQVHDLRMRKSFKALSLLTRRGASDDLPEDLDALVVFSSQNYRALSSYTLDETADLSEGIAREYSIKIPDRPVCGISVSPAMDFLPETGVMRIELLDAQHRVIRWSSVALSSQVPYATSTFRFDEPLSKSEISEKRLILRISVANCDIPVRIREWQRVDLLRARIAALPFIAFVWQPEN